MKLHAGFVAIVGVPNAGKSTFLNALLGDKLAGVSPKPQTTRRRIKGIYTTTANDLQIVFVDTPGYHEIDRLINLVMVEEVQEALSDADAVAFITDGSIPFTDEEERLLEMVGKLNIPKFAIINKSDLPRDAEKEKRIKENAFFSSVFSISATLEGRKTESGELTDMCARIGEKMPEAEALLYPDGIISDMTEREQAVEILQEKAYRLYHQEVPYSIYAEVLTFTENEEQITIEADIVCEQESQKPIIIGAGAEMIKKLRMSAQKELTAIYGKKTRLTLFVRVEKNWSRNKGRITERGHSKNALKKASRKKEGKR